MDTPEMTDYQRHLVETHLPLAKRIARQRWQANPNGSHTLEYSEFLSAASLGLVTAAIRFDPEWRPPADPNYDPFLAFGSFAARRIRGEILDWLKAMDYMPRRYRTLHRKVTQLMDSTPGISKEDIARKLEVDVDLLDTVAHAATLAPVTMDNTTASSIGARGPRPDSEQVAVSIQEMVADTVEKLPDFEKSVIVLRYYMGWEFSQIAQELESTLHYVRVAHQEAVLQLHDAMLRLVGP